MYLVYQNTPIPLKTCSASFSLYGGFIYAECEPVRRVYLPAGAKVYLNVKNGSFVCLVNRTYENTVELVGLEFLLKGYLTKRIYYSAEWSGFEEVDFDSETYISPEVKTFINPLGREVKYAVIYRSSATTIPQHKCRVGWRLKLPEAGIEASIRTMRINPSGAFTHEIGVVNSSDLRYYMKASSYAQTTWSGEVFNYNVSASDSASAVELRILNYATSFTAGTFYYGGYWAREATFYVTKTTQSRVLNYEKNMLNIPFSLRKVSGSLDDTYEYKSDEEFYDFAQACEVFARMLDQYFFLTESAVVFNDLSALKEFEVASPFEESLSATYTAVELWNNPVPTRINAQGNLLNRANSVLSRTGYSNLIRILDFESVAGPADAFSESTVNSIIKKAWVQENIQQLNAKRLKIQGNEVPACSVSFPFALSILGETVYPVAVEYRYHANEITIDMSNIIFRKRR